MKTKSLLSLFIGLLALFVMSENVKAQSTDSQVNPRLYIVTQSSATCTMCTDNNERWNSEIVKNYANDPSVVFINYDITDDNTMSTSRADLDRYGIYNSLSAYNNPGSVYLIDPVTKQVVGTTTLSANTQDILKSINSGSPSPSK